MSATTEDRLELLRTGLLIGDTWVRETSAGTMDHVNPATGKVQRAFPIAGRREVDDAIAAARQGLVVWRQLAPVERRNSLLRLAALMRAHAEEFGTITTLENGTITAMANMAAPIAADFLEYYAGWADKITGEVIPFPNAFDYTLAEPYGVVAILLTWNGPTGMLGMKAAAALAAGCAIVVKPPELAPFSACLFGELCLEAGFPPGVVNIVTGGWETGDILVRHPGIDKVSFTGGPATAKAIQAACAESLTPLTLELGGKSANIVLESADLDQAALLNVMGITMLSGQACIAPTRLLVEDSVYDGVVERVVAGIEQVRVGDPFDSATHMGPVISEAACERILGTVERAKQDGAGELLLGGHRLGGDLAGGHYIAPTVFADVDNSSDLAQKEVFGPVLSILRFQSEDEAVAIANDSMYGLAAYVNTRDLTQALRLAAALEVGSIAINGGTPMAGPFAPFGGFKDSGYGKEGGHAGLMEFVRTKNVNIGLS